MLIWQRARKVKSVIIYSYDKNTPTFSLPTPEKSGTTLGWIRTLVLISPVTSNSRLNWDKSFMLDGWWHQQLIQ